MLDQHGPDVLLSVYGDNPGIAATVGNYRSATNFATLLTRTMTEPRFSAMPYRIYERHY